MFKLLKALFTTKPCQHSYVGGRIDYGYRVCDHCGMVSEEDLDAEYERDRQKRIKFMAEINAKRAALGLPEHEITKSYIS